MQVPTQITFVDSTMKLSPERVHLFCQIHAPVLSNTCTCFVKRVHLFFHTLPGNSNSSNSSFYKSISRVRVHVRRRLFFVFYCSFCYCSLSFLGDGWHGDNRISKYSVRTYARTYAGRFFLIFAVTSSPRHLPLDLRSLLGWICNPTVMSISIFNA